MRPCTTANCERELYAKGLCKYHYSKQPHLLEKYKKTSSLYRAKNANRIKEYSKDYVSKHKSQLSENKSNWRNNNINQIKQREKTYKKSSKGRYTNLLSQAKQRNISINLTIEEFSYLINLDCFYCSGYFSKVVYGSGLDRIDNHNLGYSKDNVVSCCAECNRIRSDRYTTEETKIMITALINYRKSNAT